MSFFDRLFRADVRARAEVKSVNIPWTVTGAGAPAGPRATRGIPAVAAGIAFIADVAGVMPTEVWERRDNRLLPRPDSWQHELLCYQPELGRSPVEWRSAAIAALVEHGEVFFLKVPGPGKTLGELLLLEAGSVTRDRDSAGRRVYLHNGDSLGADRVLAVVGPRDGESILRTAARTLESGVSIERMGNEFFANGSTPSGYLQFPGSISQVEADEAVRMWEDRHSWSRGRGGGTAALGGGAEFKPIAVSLRDAQFVEAHNLTGEQVCRLLRIPAALMGYGDSVAGDTADLVSLFARLTVGPWNARLDGALSGDRDLFPRVAGARMFARANASEVLRQSDSERFAAYTSARQGSWITANEIRAIEGYPPVAGGDEILHTPVGGAPNVGASDDGWP